MKLDRRRFILALSSALALAAAPLEALFAHARRSGLHVTIKNGETLSLSADLFCATLRIEDGGQLVTNGYAVTTDELDLTGGGKIHCRLRRSERRA